VLGSSGPAPGTNAELVRRSALLAVDPAETTDADREHVMPFFYRHPERYRLRGVDVPFEAATVDTVEDLARLEAQ
jgi:spore coat polysaccharide biosynthesis protein SpsF (cytidylyltransferase family)